MGDAEGSVTSQSVVTLREIDAGSVRTICELSVREEQSRLVAPNAVSMAEAHFAEHAWFRAVYADETPVGFVMLEDDPDAAEVFLWRFMIDARYQRSGLGRRALELVIAHVRAHPASRTLATTVVPEPGAAQEFYEKLGFVATGEYEEGESVLRMTFE